MLCTSLTHKPTPPPGWKKKIKPSGSPLKEEAGCHPLILAAHHIPSSFNLINLLKTVPPSRYERIDPFFFWFLSSICKALSSTKPCNHGRAESVSRAVFVETERERERKRSGKQDAKAFSFFLEILSLNKSCVIVFCLHTLSILLCVCVCLCEACTT